MEDNTETKGPALRRGRRLSVESDTVSSPATPTKKKSSRLAAKPLLENIKEDTPVSSPKPTRRRSTARDLDDDKPLTPSRRSTRIRSNTSLVLDTTATALDSPRAKRAARRNSVADSDNEAPPTPVRQTRKTRKNSVSNVENTAETTKQVIEDTIAEEPEIQNEGSDNTSPSSFRRSPRLAKRSSKKSGEFASESTEIVKSAKKSPKVTKEKLNESVTLQNDAPPDIPHIEKDIETENETDYLNKEVKIVISPVITHNEGESKKNRTTSLMETFETTKDKNSKRQRTKSWTTVTSEKEPDNKFNKSLNFVIDRKGSGDFFKVDTKEDNSSKVIDEVDHCADVSVAQELKEVKENEDINLILDSKSQNVECKIYIEESDSNEEPPKAKTVQDDNEDDQCVPVLDSQVNVSVEKGNRSVAKDFFQGNNINNSRNDSCEPMDVDETLSETIAMQMDSHQNNISREKINTSKDDSEIIQPEPQLKNEITNNSLNKSNQRQSLSKSLKDIDNDKEEHNKSIDDQLIKSPNDSNVNVSGNNKSKRKSSLSIIQNSEHTTNETNSFKVSEETKTAEFSENKTLNNAKSHISFDETDSNVSINKKQKRKSSLSQTQVDKSLNENKSTFILSQVQDPLAENSMNKSKTKNTSLLAHNKQNISEIHDNTPLRNKNFKNLGIQTSTPVAPIDKESKGKAKKRKEKEESESSESSETEEEEVEEEDGEDSESDAEYSAEVNEGALILAEAEDAGEDYESGDSREDDSFINDVESEESESETDEENQPSDDDAGDEQESEEEQDNAIEVNDTSVKPFNEVQVDENASMSIMKNTTTDPLQGEQSDDADDASLCSENQEIMKDYDSVLDNLNKDTKKKIKQNDISLDIERKPKRKQQVLVDQLNLTQTENRKKIEKKQQSNVQNNEVKVIKPAAKLESSDSESVQSADLHLLLSDTNSNDADTLTSNAKNKDENTADYIPLKKSFGSTNLLDQTLQKLNKSVDKENENKTKLDTSLSKKQASKLETSLSKGKKNTSKLETSISNEKDIEMETSLTKGKKNKSNLDTSINKQKENTDLVVNTKIVKSTEKQKQKDVTVRSKKRTFQSMIEDDKTSTEQPADAVMEQSVKAKAVYVDDDDEMPEEIPSKRSKRKAMEDDADVIPNKSKKSKVLKENRLDNVPIPRLPSAIIQRLGEKTERTPKVVSTSDFIIEETAMRRNKPSQFLEQSINITTDPADKVMPKRRAPLPKVLPFVPTALASAQGFTTRFQISVFPKDAKFTAQTTNMTNFKNDYLFGKHIKRMGNNALFKKNRNNKMAKF